MIIGLVLAVGALFLVVNWHARTFAYRCCNCDNEFVISAPLDFISPHAFDFKGGWKLLRCPRCGHWTRAHVIRKPTMSDDGQPWRSP